MMYPLTLTPDDNDTLLVTSSLLPEVTTFGETWADAIHQGAEAVEEALAARMSRWEDIPVPDAKDVEQAFEENRATRISLLADMKVTLYLACKEAGVSRADLTRRLGWHREQVDRLFRFDHKSRPDQIEAAIKAIGKVINLEVVDYQYAASA
ncbi:MAG: type II toxin-antitoxin system HicB family antitoxin [Bauldia sp.]